VADWVLLTTEATGRAAVVIDILDALKESLARAKGVPYARPPRSPQLQRYIFLNTTYELMKSRWAVSQSADGFWIGAASPDEEAELKAQASNWSSSKEIPFIRPATTDEIEKAISEQREHQRWSIINEVWDKWGFDCEGQRKEGIPDSEVSRRLEEADREIRGRLDQLGFLKGSGFE
jgi:hypothetical protein